VKSYQTVSFNANAQRATFEDESARQIVNTPAHKEAHKAGKRFRQRIGVFCASLWL
jgi:hypothetical protein